jgi:hypothetical protein
MFSPSGEVRRGRYTRLSNSADWVSANIGYCHYTIGKTRNATHAARTRGGFGKGTLRFAYDDVKNFADQLFRHIQNRIASMRCNDAIMEVACAAIVYALR